MNLYGYLLLIFAMVSITALVSWCFYKVFRVQKMNIHAPLEIETEEGHPWDEK